MELNVAIFSKIAPLRGGMFLAILAGLCACQPAYDNSNTGFETPPTQTYSDPAPQEELHGDTSVVNGREVINASPTNPSPEAFGNPGLSDENDFEAVSSRQTIESDKARLEANSARYSQIQPTHLPSRLGEEQPNIVAYALQTSHPVGEGKYRRSNLISTSKHQRNCAVYRTSDDAQIDFLTRGGPQKDRLALDPDGDGYACGWNPAKYRQ